MGQIYHYHRREFQIIAEDGHQWATMFQRATENLPVSNHVTYEQQEIDQWAATFEGNRTTTNEQSPSQTSQKMDQWENT